MCDHVGVVELLVDDGADISIKVCVRPPVARCPLPVAHRIILLAKHQKKKSKALDSRSHPQSMVEPSRPPIAADAVELKQKAHTNRELPVFAHATTMPI